MIVIISLPLTMNNYKRSIHLGTSKNATQYGPILEPLTHKYPTVMPYHNHGTLDGLRPTPISFTNNDTNAKHMYVKQCYTPSIPSKGVKPMDSSLRARMLSTIAIGKSSTKTGLPLNEPLTNKSFSPSETKSRLQRMRSSGCVAPKKKMYI